MNPFVQLIDIVVDMFSVEREKGWRIIARCIRGEVSDVGDSSTNAGMFCVLLSPWFFQEGLLTT